MKNLLVIIVGLLIFISCKTENPRNDGKQSNQKTERQDNKLIAIDYSVNHESVKAGEPVELNFEVKTGTGETIKNFEVVHEKLIHLIIVSEDLKEFYHIHPELRPDGSFITTFTFPNGGYYRLYADLTPQGYSQIVKDFTQIVVGAERAKEPLKTDNKFEKTIDGLRVVMSPDAVLESGKEAMLNFQVFDAATEKPVTDLEKYLGEYAHFVIISEDLRDFVHAHPVSRSNVKSENHQHDSGSTHDEKLMDKDAESIVSAHVTFPNAAKYKIWVQFQRAGKVVEVPFAVEVKQGKAEKTLTDAKIPEGAFKIVISKDGFAPQEMSYLKGQPLKIAFVRLDEDNCGDEIVIRELNIKKKLPVGEVITVDIPTAQAGEINFACINNIFKGKIVIQ